MINLCPQPCTQNPLPPYNRQSFEATTFRKHLFYCIWFAIMYWKFHNIISVCDFTLTQHTHTHICSKHTFEQFAFRWKGECFYCISIIIRHIISKYKTTTTTTTTTVRGAHTGTIHTVHFMLSEFIVTDLSTANAISKHLEGLRLSSENHQPAFCNGQRHMYCMRQASGWRRGQHRDSHFYYIETHSHSWSELFETKLYHTTTLPMLNVKSNKIHRTPSTLKTDISLIFFWVVLGLLLSVLQLPARIQYFQKCERNRWNDYTCYKEEDGSEKCPTNWFGFLFGWRKLLFYSNYPSGFAHRSARERLWQAVNALLRDFTSTQR